MGDALRRHRAPRLLVGRTRAVFEGQLPALEHRRAHRAERMLVHAPQAMRDDAHAFDRPALAAPACRVGMLVEQFLDALLQRRQRAGQHAAAAAREQLLGRQQRVQLFRIQPQPRQFEAVAFAGVVAEAGLAVADHRRHQRVAQEGQVAIDGGARAAQFLLQPRHRHRIARGLEDAVQGEDAFVAVHARIMQASAGMRRCARRRGGSQCAACAIRTATEHRPCDLAGHALSQRHGWHRGCWRRRRKLERDCTMKRARAQPVAVAGRRGQDHHLLHVRVPLRHQGVARPTAGSATSRAIRNIRSIAACCARRARPGSCSTTRRRGCASRCCAWASAAAANSAKSNGTRRCSSRPAGWRRSANAIPTNSRSSPAATSRRR